MKTKENESHFWLSLATPPFFFGVTAIQSIAQGLIELGQMSEEIFRGERLPLLNFPDASPDDPLED